MGNGCAVDRHWAPHSLAGESMHVSAGLLVTSIATCLLCLICAGQLGLAASSPSSSQQQGGLATTAAGDSVADMRRNVFQFWLQHGPDQQYGGFHGTLDRQGSPISPTNKTLVQQVTDTAKQQRLALVHSANIWCHTCCGSNTGLSSGNCHSCNDHAYARSTE